MNRRPERYNGLTIVTLMICLGAMAVSAQMSVGCNFWNPTWEPASDYFKANVNWATETNPWNPVFLTDCAPYGCLRFINWCAPLVLNNTPGVWSQRCKKTDGVLASSGAMAYEWMIDLGNRLNKDIWICVPATADTAYAYQLAQLLYTTLNGNLKCWVEYCNECWNFDATWFQQQGAALGLNGSTPEAQGFAFVAYKSVRIWEQFEKVYGKNSPRLGKVLCGQADNQSVIRMELAGVDDTVKVNPRKVKPDAMGIAPYMRGADVAGCRAQLNAKYGEARVHYNIARVRGLKVVCYEAGLETATGDAISSDPSVYQLYKDYLDTLKAGGVNGPCNQYCAVGGGNYSWGAKNATGQAENAAHKWRAIRDWNAVHPPVGVARSVRPADKPASGNIDVTGIRFCDLSGHALKGAAAMPASPRAVAIRYRVTQNGKMTECKVVRMR